MKNLRRNFNRYCLRHSSWGIPNLMLYVTIGTAIVYLMTLFNGGAVLFDALRFDKTLILQGQVWRLITFVFTYSPGSSIFTLIFLFFFYTLGKTVEQRMGTFKFNLFYFSGILFMDIFAMIFYPSEAELTAMYFLDPDMWYGTQIVYLSMAYYLHLSLLLAFATLSPDSQFLVMFVIPVKAWVMGIIYLLFVLVEIFNATVPANCFPHNLFPLVSIANYFLIFGSDIKNLFPIFQRTTRPHKPQGGPIPFRGNPQGTTKQAPKVDYHHRCTICGRTDVSHPQLEFRYCSKCNGFFCYCQDHINNHTHIQ